MCCSDCWPRQGPHRPKKKGRDGVPHEKTNPLVVRKLKNILNPTKNAEEIQQLHEDDEATKWFGVTRDATGRPTFEDYGRYQTLMANISPVEGLSNRYPQLVSFIGVTNAGKSTLIRMLVEYEINCVDPSSRALFPSPVVGSVVNDAVPTSGDVHLYADPTTHEEQLPILYADCEGFEGGERTPLGAKSRKGKVDEPERRVDVYARPIQWATTEESRRREYAVTALYPRLLYTFSDCVVFVLRNPKTFQSAVLTKLIDWGCAAIEKSINQPALPHCVIALNGSDPGVDDSLWEIESATKSLLNSVKGALDIVEGVPRFRELADYWRGLGETINTIEDLILRYYSTFKVVRIPAKPRYMKINEQIGKLHATIKGNCEESFRAKRRARMLTNADELNTYLQSGFDHFTTHLHIPFNFMQISLLRNPIPNDFGGHILQLCTTIASQQPNHQPSRVAWMFEKLSVMLASCVLLDCARFRKGRVDELFSNYEKFFDYAMGEYLELHYPCSYTSPDGTRQCMLVKARHQPKGHQDEKGIIAAGDYEAAFDADFLINWKAQLRAAIEGLHRDFTHELEQVSQIRDMNAVPEERIALDLHVEYLNLFYEAIGPATSICSHATCFCCLMDVPEHPLPCGHVLCNACIKAYGTQVKSSVHMSCCPLHRDSTNWARPTVIKYKPPSAGTRVLALDGGGIRGIVQLEVLRAIEQVLGGHLPVQTFFDLIVGTGMGALIAVSLSLKDRSVDSCIDMFTALCGHAYTPRLKSLPIVSQLVHAIGSGPKYKTKPLHAALKTAFSEENEFFGSMAFRNGARVAVTTTSATGRDSIVLANYRRPDDPSPDYVFERPHEPEMELKTWQSVAAALATPSHFRPFIFYNKTYLDGGVTTTSPVFVAEKERKLIWPDAGEPDLFLCLGTGQNRISVLEKLTARSKELTSSGASTIGTHVEDARRTAKKLRSRKDEIMESEFTWQDFRAHAVKERVESKARRFVRFNPDLDREPPSSDSKSELESLQGNVRKRLQTPHRLAALRNVAHRLVATSFYFELQSKVTGEKNEQICRGTIAVRFDDHSQEMCALGKVLADRCTEDFEPYFFIKPNYDSDDSSITLPITADVIRAMTNDAVFEIPSVGIPLRDETKATSITLFLSAHDGLEPDGFPISGFPRVILGEAANPNTRRPMRESAEHAVRLSTRSSQLKPGSDEDSISLNGSTIKPPYTTSNSSEESWQDTQARMNSVLNQYGQPKMSLADLIAQHQTGGGTSVKQRTNRFWSYIGNKHIAQNPDKFSPEQVNKYVGTGPTSPALSPGFPTGSSLGRGPPSSIGEETFVHELEANDGLPQDMQRTRLHDAPHEGIHRVGSHAGDTNGSSLGTIIDEEASDPDDWQEARQARMTQVEVVQSQTSPSPPSYRERSSSDTRSPLDEFVETALPDPNTKSLLNNWLKAQRSTTTLHKAPRLNVVDEEGDDTET